MTFKLHLIGHIILATQASALFASAARCHAAPSFQPHLQVAGKTLCCSSSSLRSNARVRVSPTIGLSPSDEADNQFSASMGAWVPIGSRSSLSGLGPRRIKVMGLDLVVWETEGSKTRKLKKGKISESQWSVMRDACSHKYAALSSGRVNPDTSCIECPYHGWQFDTNGSLTHIPQMETTSKLSDVLVDKASIPSYSVHVTGDLIWAFLPTSIHGESFPKNLLPEDYYDNGLRRDVDSGANFAVMELPASYDFYMENAMDPCHISFAHHGFIGNRADASPFPIELIPSNFTHFGFKTSYYRKGEYRERTYGIQRPFNFFTIEKDLASGSWKPGAVAFFVPIEEGRVRFITSLGGNKLAKLPLPNWLIHLLVFKLSEGDSILHDAELFARSKANSKLVDNDKTPDSLNYITPTTSDVGVIAFRSWWKKYGLSNSPPHTFGPASSHNLKPISKHVYDNPWWTHTKSCAHCRDALRKARKLQKLGLMMGFFGSIYTCALSKRRPVIAVLVALAGWGVSSIGKKLTVALEGSSHLSDVRDRVIPLD